MTTQRFVLIFSFLICKGTNSVAQDSKPAPKVEAELKTIVNNFTNYIIKKDSVAFFNLFNENPVPFVRMESKDMVKEDYYNDDYKMFFRAVSNKGYTKVKTDSIFITQDDYTATVSFNYSFLQKGKKKAWGKESLGFIYKYKSWRINRVIYSMELEEGESKRR